MPNCRKCGDMCWRCDRDAFNAGLCLSCYEKSAPPQRRAQASSSRASVGELEARLKDAEELNKDLLRAREESVATISRLQQSVRNEATKATDKDAELARMRTELAQRDIALREVQHGGEELAQRDAALRETIRQRDAELGRVRAELTAKDGELARRDTALRERDAELAQRDGALQEARETIAQLRGIRGLVDFGSSEFKREYDLARRPEFQDQLLAAVREVVFDYAESKGLPHADTVLFLQQLQSEWSLADAVGKAAQKVWTSAKRLGGIEFCSMYNSTTRCDRAARASAVLARALNINLVTRGGAGPQAVPLGPDAGGQNISTQEHVCWRGGGFKDISETRAFFVVGKEYRVPQHLSTSFDRAVAKDFIARAVLGDDIDAYVLWKICIDPDLGCDHVNLVTETHVPGEFEYLFSLFSAFSVSVVNWSATPADPQTPHEITIRAAADNSRSPLDLPLAPWC